MRARAPTAVLLSALIVAFAYSQPAQQDPPKDKETPPDQTKLPEWPTSIDNKGVYEWLKDVDNPDPSTREFALKTLPSFGPSARKICSKKLVERMTVEKDPGVRIAVFNTAAVLGLEDSDVKPAVAILARIVEQGAAGGLSRLHAVQTLALIGSKAELAVSNLTGVACTDPAYETRRSIANALGQVGFNEVNGPNVKALNRLAGTFAKDESAAVRMEALQSLVLLGPPWAGPAKGKTPPTIDWKSATFVADRMRERLGMAKTKSPVESDIQLEIWCRVVLMRFDPKEINDSNLDAVAKHLEARDLGAKLQALQALSLFGEEAAKGKRLDMVLSVLPAEDTASMNDINPVVVNMSLGTLVAMGKGHSPESPHWRNWKRLWRNFVISG
jgi:hypothetical protein